MKRLLMKRNPTALLYLWFLLPALLLVGVAGLIASASAEPPLSPQQAANGSAPAASPSAPVAPAKSAAPPVSFANDLVPVFTKAGCNNGTCHGQQNGKGGFKLSLRGWDPAFDWEQIVA